MGLHEMTLILLMALENSVPEIVPQKKYFELLKLYSMGYKSNTSQKF